MTSNKDMFAQIEENVSEQVMFGDNNQVSIANKGSIAFKVKTGQIMHMHDTLYVPGPKHNLLSIGQMCLKNYSIVLKKKSCTITNEINR